MKKNDKSSSITTTTMTGGGENEDVDDESGVVCQQAAERTCAHCGKHGDTQTIRLCTGCKAIRYCSRDCQKGDWSRHNAACKKAKHSK